ncbi:hypothetical protein JCM10908_006166 [Rhodotorula pacifica]|uniref:uncharacterized protein n=1 Tax=Rhodotorula pacifica TaxID=1495444 RepID=UPI003173AF59
MNDRQAEELLALEAIYPDLVTWAELPAGRGVEVRINAPVDFEEAREVEVGDWRPASIASSQSDAASLITAFAASSLEGRQAVPKTSAPSVSRNAASASRRRKGGGNVKSARLDKVVPLVATAKAFQPRSPVSEVRPANLAASPVRQAGNGSDLQQEHPNAAVATSPPPRDPPRVRLVPRQELVPLCDEASAAAAESPAGSGVTEPPRSRRLFLRHLPAIYLSLRLPPGYPETEAPSSISISDEDQWLGPVRRRAAERKLGELYSGDECLLYILDSVSSTSSDFDSTFSLHHPLVLRQEAPDSDASSASVKPLSTFLSDFDRQASSAQFATSSHACPLCFTTQRGSACVCIASCGCVFCTDCLKDYFSLLITEGLVRSVACPSRPCVEQRAQWEKDETTTSRRNRERDDTKPGRVTANEIEQLVGEEGRKRWEWLQEKARVESDPSITWCPREACQAPVPKLSEDEEKLRVCPACDYSFCVFCRRGWHGTRNACALPQSSAIVSGYLSGDAEQRRTLEVRYGAANIKRLVAAYEEERALQEWLQAHSTQCPGCSAWVEKSQGCNHMTCAKCASHFCYRCGKSISPRDPYKHFSTPGMSCYGKLFDFAPGQEPEPEQWVNFLGEDAY